MDSPLSSVAGLERSMMAVWRVLRRRNPKRAALLRANMIRMEASDPHAKNAVSRPSSLGEKARRIEWVSLDGRRQLIADMDPVHAKNSLALIMDALHRGRWITLADNGCIRSVRPEVAAYEISHVVK